jgi:hypothetical protein
VSGRGILDRDTPITAANVAEFAAAVKGELHKSDAALAEQLADVNARIEAARVEGIIQEALGYIPMLAVFGVPPAAAEIIARGLTSAARLIGLAPDVFDAVKDGVDP